MRQTLAVTVAFFLISAAARAGGSHEQTPPHGPPSQPGHTAMGNDAGVARAGTPGHPVATAQSNASPMANASGGAGGRANASTGPVTVNNSAGGDGGSLSNRDNTPDILAPSISGGNPCAVGGTGGLSLPGFGIVGGYSGEAANCVLRQKIALLWNMGFHAAAKNLACQGDTYISNAFAMAGEPCEADIRRWRAAGWKG